MTETSPSPHVPVIQRNWPKLLVTFAVSALVLFVLIRYLAGARSLADTLREAHWEWIWVPFAWMSLNVVIASARWNLILDTTGYKVPFRQIMFAVLSTWPLALVTPSRASDLLRAWVIRDKVPLPQGTGTVTAEKVIDLQSLGLYTTCGGLITGLWLWGFLGLAALITLWISVLLLLQHLDTIAEWRWLKKYQQPIRRFFWVFRDIKQNPHRFVLISALSLLGWLGAIGIITSLLWIYKAPIAAGQTITLWPIALFIAHIPVTFAGMGTRDTAFLSLIWITSHQVVPEASIIAATLTYALVTIVYPALLGIIPMFQFLSQLRQSSAAKQGDKNP